MRGPTRAAARAMAWAIMAWLLVLAVALPAAAAWTAPTVVDSGRDISAGRVGVDDAGHLHIVAEDATGLFYRTDASGSWVTTRLWDGDVFASEMDLRVDGAGNVYVAWAQACSCVNYHSLGILYLTNAFGGPNAGWPATPRTLVTGNAQEPSLRLYEYKVHLAWTQKQRVWYGNDVTGGWVQVAVSPAGSWGNSPSLVVAPATRARLVYNGGGRLHYAWNTGSNGQPHFRSERIPGSVDGWSPALALDAQLRPHVAYGLEQGTCAAGPACGPLRRPAGSSSAGRGPSPATLWGTQIAVRTANGWTPVSRRRVTLAVGDNTLLLDDHGRFHLLTGNQVVSDATGAIVRKNLGLAGDPWWFAMDITDGGLARVIYQDGDGAAAQLLLVREH
ncbi:MAG: hypothetical protein U0869_01665 [Chloroflexota bacterium]